MTLIHSIAGSTPGRVDPTPRRAADDTPQAQAIAGAPRGTDRVDLSEQARSLGRAERPFRADLVDRIRKEIADGAYETPERLDAAAERLSRDLDLLA